MQSLCRILSKSSVIFNIQKNFKSLYKNLPETEHANLVGLSDHLYFQNRDKYALLKPPDLKPKVEMTVDWNDIHETSVMYGSPELADHMSGFIYMSVSMYEDKCSQSFRVADHIHELDNFQLQTALEHCCQWPLKTVSESDALQKVIQSIDTECYKRTLKESWRNNEELMKTAYLFSLNILKYKDPKFLREHISNPKDTWKEYPEIFMILAAINNIPVNYETKIESLLSRAQ